MTQKKMFSSKNFRNICLAGLIIAFVLGTVYSNRLNLLMGSLIDGNTEVCSTLQDEVKELDQDIKNLDVEIQDLRSKKNNSKAYKVMLNREKMAHERDTLYELLKECE